MNTHVYIKYNIATHKMRVLLINQDGKQKILTKQGRWIPWTEQAELLDASNEISDIHRYDPRSSPPD